MPNPEGQIVSLQTGRSGCRAVVVRIDAGFRCDRCLSGRGCGAGLLGLKSGEKQVEATVLPHIDVSRGDQVCIELAPNNILKAAFIVYGYPLLGAVVSATAAYVLGLADVAAAVASLAGLAAGILIARLRLIRTRCLRDFTPMVVARMRSGQ